MKNFQDRDKKGKRIFKSIPFLFIMFVFLIFFAIGVFSLFDKMKDTLKNKNIAKEKLENLENRKNKLLLDISNLNTEKGKEKVFRENYGLGKDGEKVIVIVDEKEVANVKEENALNKDFFSKIIDLFR